MTQCRTPNGFAMVNGYNDLMLSNLGKKFEDYENGSFWARDWEAGGADPNELKREFPFVLLENLEVYDDECGRECRKYAITVVGEYDCNECGGCNRTKEQVGDDTEAMLKKIVREFKRTGKFENDEGVQLWASIPYGESQDWSYQEESIGDILDGQELKYFEISQKMPTNTIGWTVNFEICDCPDIEELIFDYGPKDMESVGVTECEDCP